MLETKKTKVKDVFIDYLRDFIKALQQNSYSIEAILKNISPDLEELVLGKVLEYNKSIPRVDREVSTEAIKDNITGRWANLKNWFLGDVGRESETTKLFSITNEIIRKITRFAFPSLNFTTWVPKRGYMNCLRIALNNDMLYCIYYSK